MSVPSVIADMIFTIRKTLADQKKQMSEGTDVTNSDLVEPPYVSDRRWKKVVWIMKTSACLNGRNKVDYSDCLLMTHMLWDNDDQIYSVTKLVAEAVANSIRYNGLSGIIDKVSGKRYVKPVGTPLCPDGKNYVFDVGDDEMLISKEDYEALDISVPSFFMLRGNQLVKADKETSLRVTKTDTGLCINTFSYSIKRDSSLMSAGMDSLIDDIKSDINAMEDGLKSMIDGNIFIPGFSKLHELRMAFVNVRNQIIRKGGR